MTYRLMLPPNEPGTPDGYQAEQWMGDDPTAVPHLAADPTVPPHEGALDGLELVEPETATLDGPYVLKTSVKDWVLQRLRSAEKDGELEEILRTRVIVNNVLMYRGAHDCYATAEGTVDSLYGPEDDEPQMYNWFAQQVDGKAKEWESSKPRVELTGRTRDYRLEAAARLSEALDSYVRRDIKAHFRQSEAKFGMLGKFYLRYSFLDADETDQAATRVKVPVTEQRRFHVGAVLSCRACGEDFKEPDDLEGAPVDSEHAPHGPCPACEGTDHDEVSPRYPYNRSVETGEREVVVPRLRHISVNPLNVKMDHRARTFAQSPYHIYETLERRFDMERQYPDEDLSRVEAAGGNLPVRMTALLALERTTAGVGVSLGADITPSETREDELVRCRRFWMLPRMYAHYRAGRDELFCGVEIKAGDRLGDHFPSGWLTIYYGEERAVEARDESKNLCWAGSPFTLDPTTLHGKGSEDLTNVNLTIDDMATMAVSNFDKFGAPKEIVDPRLVDPDEIDGDTGKRLVMKETAPTDDGKYKASDAIHVVQPPQLGSDFIAYFMGLPSIMREIGGTGAPSLGQNDPDNPTARGREIAMQMSSSLLIPSLSLRAEEVEEETTYQNLEYCQQYWQDEDFALFESEFGQEAIDTFQQLNLRRDLVAEAVPGSWVPETRESELANMEEFGIKYLMPMAQGAVPLSYVRHAARLYNIPSAAFEPQSDERIARARLSVLRQYAARAYQAGATELSPAAYQFLIQGTFAAERMLQPRTFENHGVQAAFLAEQWKDLFDDRQANPVLMDYVEYLIGLHQTATAAQMLTSPAKQATDADADQQQGREERSKQADHARSVELEKTKAKSRPKPAGKKGGR